MKRRVLLKTIAMVTVLPLIPGCWHTYADDEAISPIKHLQKSHEEWQKLLSPKAYQILFEEATERPESSNLVYEDREGIFICAACYLPLFESVYKYESWTGWPSFTQPIAGHIATKMDFKLIWPRTEYHCARCKGHQGHVFMDGPPPRGERWCNNGIALNFVPKEAPIPTLRS